MVLKKNEGTERPRPLKGRTAVSYLEGSLV